MNACLKFILTLLLIAAAATLPAQDLKGIWTGGLTKDTSGIRVINPGYIVNIKEQANNIIRGKAYVIERKHGLEGVLDFIGVLRGDLVMISEINIRSSITPVDTLWLCLKSLKLALSPEKNKMYGKWTGRLETMQSCMPATAHLSRYTAKSPVRIPDKILNYIATDPGPSQFETTRLSDPVAITVRSRSIKISISDYQRTDNDTISVFLNREKVINKLGISAKPYEKGIRLNRETGMNELVIYAENLGRVPPNTCTLIVDDGIQKQSVNILSSKQVSAAIYIKYEPETSDD